MLCGLYTPDSGTAEILDHDIRYDLEKIRSSIGFCPQININYDELTVYQHLDLICSLKGFNPSEIRREIRYIAKYVGLENDLNKKSKELSGGMKRRLSVAMAFIGDSKVIILDEPTSGLDPFNRRGLWELIRKYKKDRTIILTTHYMEEADALSDRIALINKGQVKCCGSPLFLKDRFGSGYKLTITKAPHFSIDKMAIKIEESMGSNLSIQTDVAREICYLIPQNQRGKISSLLNVIEKEKATLGILNYGVSSTTVEDVYINIESDETDETVMHESEVYKAIFDPTQSEKCTGLSLYLTQLSALILKRLRIFRRRYMIAFLNLIFPFFLILLSYFLPNSTSLYKSLITSLSSKNGPSLSMKMEIYKGKWPLNIPYKLVESNNDNLEFETHLAQHFMNRNLNVRLMNVQNDTINNFVLKKRSEKRVENLIYDYLFGFEFKFESKKLDKIFIYYSTMSDHSSGVGLSELSDFLLSFKTTKSRSIKTVISPISKLTAESIEHEPDFDLSSSNCIEILPFSILDFLMGILIAFIIGFTTIHLTRERKSKSKNLQVLSGCESVIYWLSNFSFDFVIHFINISCTIFLIWFVAWISTDANDHSVFTSNKMNLLYLFFFLIFSSLSWSSFSYIWSLLFKSEIYAFASILVLMILVNFVDMIFGLLNYLIIIGSAVDKRPTNFVFFLRLSRILLALLFPNVNAKRFIFNLKIINTKTCANTQHFMNNFFNKNDTHTISYDVWPFLVNSLVFLAMCLTILLLVENFKLFKVLESKILSKKRGDSSVSGDKLDEDVLAEQNRVDLNEYDERKEPIFVKDLYKNYLKDGRIFSAVDNLSFGINSGEIFALLGQNGAGKSTTIEILIGEKLATSGVCYLNGKMLKFNSYNKSMGYCPQSDLLPEYLTVQEALELYACIRGLKRDSYPGLIKKILSSFKLNDFKNLLVQNLR
jgi:ATP-binding cassette subfamily A (ABC1) protein 3